MGLFNSTTDTFWLFGTLVLTLSYLHATPFEDIGFIKAFSYFLTIPFEILGTLFAQAPIIAVFGMVLNIFFFHFLVENLGEGYLMVATMAFLAVTIGVGVVGG